MQRPRHLFDFPLGADSRRPLCFGAPRQVLCADSPADVRATIRAAERCARDGAWVAGFVSYEAAPAFDPAHRVHPSGGLPLAWFGVFDRPASDPELPGGPAPAPGHWTLACGRPEYDQGVAAILDAISRGDVYQVNYTVRLRSGFAGDDLAWFLQLREAQASDYCAYLDLGRYRILSASPELFFRRDGDRLTTRPMKGTAPRGRWPEEDAERAAWLAASGKNRAENLMIVDLLRNDLSRVSQPHSVRVAQLFSVERYPTVLQMTSTVTGTARPGTGLDDVFAALFPCGSVTGAPKIKAMEIISSIERTPRQIYCGSIGVIAPGGDAVFNVAIRTILLDSETGDATCGVGGGVVWESTPGGEYDELLLKSRFLARRAEPFRLFETMRLEDGRYWLLERHLLRLSRSAAYFDYRYDEPACRDLLSRHAARHPAGRFRIRLMLSRDGELGIEIGAFPAAVSEPAPFALADAPVSSADPFLFHKTTARSVYERAKASRPGAFDVLLWNESGELTEFTRGNVVVEIDGRRITPRLSCGLLDGTLRRELLESGAIEEGTVRREDLPRATQIWFINGLRGKVVVRPEPHDG